MFATHPHKVFCTEYPPPPDNNWGSGSDFAICEFCKQFAVTKWVKSDRNTKHVCYCNAGKKSKMNKQDSGTFKSPVPVYYYQIIFLI